MKKWILFTVLALIALLLRTLVTTSNVNSTSQETTLIKANDFQIASQLNNTKNKKTTNFEPESYNQCDKFIKTYQKHKNQIGRNINWEKFLADDYHVDDITQAIEHIQNSNFASSWRVEQLRKGSTLNKSNNDIKNHIKDLIPDLPSFFHFERAVPLPDLEKINDLNYHDAHNLLKRLTLTVDDIAWLITQENIPQPLIIEALNKQNLNQIVGYDKIDAISLLDYAVNYNKDSVVEYLLNHGATISNDLYLGSTMEWALKNLMVQFWNQDQNENIVKSINIVKKLIHLGAEARFSVKNEFEIEGDFPRQFYQFKEVEIKKLYEEYQLDLKQISERKTLVVDKQSELIQIITTKISENVTKETSIKNSITTFHNCRKMISKIEDSWKPKPLKHFINQLSENKIPITKENLQEIDPILATCYLKKENPFRIEAIENSPSTKQIFKALNEKDINKAISIAESKKYSMKQKRWLFYQVLGWDTAYYSELQNSDLHQSEFNYRYFSSTKIESIKSFVEAGFDLDYIDEQGITLLHFAIQKRNLTLLKYLLSENILLNERNLSDDLLYLFLRNIIKFTEEARLAFLIELMTLQPQINHHHLHAMSLFKMRNQEQYLEIIDLFPDLVINDKTPLPKAYCEFY